MSFLWNNKCLLTSKCTAFIWCVRNTLHTVPRRGTYLGGCHLEVMDETAPSILNLSPQCTVLVCGTLRNMETYKCFHFYLRGLMTNRCKLLLSGNACTPAPAPCFGWEVAKIWRKSNYDIFLHHFVWISPCIFYAYCSLQKELPDLECASKVMAVSGNSNAKARQAFRRCPFTAYTSAQSVLWNTVHTNESILRLWAMCRSNSRLNPYSETKCLNHFLSQTSSPRVYRMDNYPVYMIRDGSSWSRLSGYDAWHVLLIILKMKPGDVPDLRGLQTWSA